MWDAKKEARQQAVRDGAFFIEAPCERLLGTKCDGTSGRTFYVTFDSHRDRVTKDDGLRFYVFACGCTEWMYRGCLWRIVDDALSEQYAEISPIWYTHAALRHRNGKQFDWVLCPCGRPPSWDWSHGLPGLLGREHRYCSWECYARDANLVCSECMSVLTPERIAKRDDTYGRELCVIVTTLFSLGISLELASKVADYPTRYYCSPACCSLARERLKQIEREERQHRKEMQCVHNVKRLLAAARRSLRRPDRDAWKSLKKEFAREAISPE